MIKKYIFGENNETVVKKDSKYTITLDGFSYDVNSLLQKKLSEQEVLDINEKLNKLDQEDIVSFIDCYFVLREYGDNRQPHYEVELTEVIITLTTNFVDSPVHHEISVMDSLSEEQSKVLIEKLEDLAQNQTISID
jgi:hypothetical protein